MRKTFSKKGLTRTDFFSYSGVALAVTFIFAMTFGVIDGPGTLKGGASGTPTLLAESSP